MGQACQSGCVSESRLHCACADASLCQECITHDEVIVGSEDGMRGVLRFRSSGSHLPKEFQTQLGRHSHLGICSLGSVVQSLHLASDSTCALKRISKKLLSSSAWRLDVERLQDLDHPHVCKTFDAFEDATSVYLVMELCRGGNLNNLARMGSRGFSEGHVAMLVYQMVQAIGYLHGLGFVHCDICPENWLFEESFDETTSPNDLCLKLIDFGLAQKYGREHPRKPTRYSYPNAPGLNSSPERRISRISNASSTQTSRSGRSRKSSSKDDDRKRPLASCKLFCQAPEQLKPVTVPNPAVDVWAIGILSYFLLLGNSPFEPSKGVTNPSNNLAFEHARYVFMPTEVWRHISNEAKSFIALCLEKEPEKRPAAQTLLSMPWMRMARTASEGEPLPMVVPEKEPQEVDAIPALSSMETSSTPRSRRSFSGISAVPGVQLAQSNVQRFNEYQAMEWETIQTVAYEVHRNHLAPLRTSLEEVDFDCSGFVQWAVLLSCIRQCGGSVAELEMDILPEVSGGLVNYNNFLEDVALFQRNSQESSLWYAFSAFDTNGRGEADRRHLQRELGNARSLITECVESNFPGIAVDSVKQGLEQVGSRVKFEDLVSVLNAAPYEAKVKEKRPLTQRF